MVADEKKQENEVIAENEAINEDSSLWIEQLTPEQRKDKMSEFFAIGKKDYIEEKFEAAVDSLEKAVQLADKEFGSKSPETFDYYLYYGKALLEVGREENALLKNAQQGIPDEDDSMVSDAADASVLTQGTLETIKEQVNEALEENCHVLEGTNGNATTEKNSHALEGTNGTANTEEVKETAATEKAEEEDGSGDESGDEEDEEDQEPIQAAWEVFEHCRLICENQPDSKEWDMKRADVLMYLGDCSAENNNFEQAIEDLCKSQELKEKHGCIGREIADVHIELARVYKLNNNFHSAAQYYEKAKGTLKHKIDLIEKEEKSNTNAKEIQDLGAILDDLQVQLDDVHESAKQIVECQQLAGEQTSAAKIPSAPTDGKTGTVIEVRRAPKRPASSDPSDDAENVEAKKMKELSEKVDAAETAEPPREAIEQP